MINLPDIFEVIDVMHTSLGQFIRMYNATQTAKCMKLISKEVDALRCQYSKSITLRFILDILANILRENLVILSKIIAILKNFKQNGIIERK